MRETFQELGQYIRAALKGEVVAVEMHQDELCLIVRGEALVKVMCFLRDDGNCLFKQLMDIAGVDYPGRKERFEVVYNLLSIRHNQRVRVKVATGEYMPVPSVVDIFPAAGWFEREAWDMYGIFFSGNPDLRRILTDYGFDDHPQRKDFPLTGFVEMRYDTEQKRVIQEPVNLRQAFRKFDFLSPWEGSPAYQEPGEESGKAKKAG